MTATVKVGREAAEQLRKMVQLYGSSILPNKDLLLLVDEINKTFDHLREKCDEEAKDAVGVRVQEPASPRSDVVSSVKRGQNYFA
jgi:hypothetical protein